MTSQMNITSIFTILLIAFSLSIDAFVVSVTAGITITKIKLGHALKIALMFGLFQAIMPLIGWFSGNQIRTIFESVEYFVVTGIFFVIGFKMLFETFLIKEEKEKDYTNFKLLLLLAVATSLDAFAAGLGFSILHVYIVIPVIIIGMVTFLTSFIGVYIGDTTGKFFGNSFGIIGGVILIGLAIRFLLKALHVI